MIMPVSTDMQMCGTCVNVFKCYREGPSKMWSECLWDNDKYKDKSNYQPITRAEALIRLIYNETGFISFDVRPTLKEFLLNG